MRMYSLPLFFLLQPVEELLGGELPPVGVELLQRHQLVQQLYGEKLLLLKVQPLCGAL